MPEDHRIEQTRALYGAYAAGDRQAAEALLGADLTFSSPVDVGLDLAGYWERCWPGSGQHQTFRFIRLIASGDEVIVTYEQTATDGQTGRNTEVLTFSGDRICRVEVYFGWDVT